MGELVSKTLLYQVKEVVMMFAIQNHGNGVGGMQVSS